LINLAKGRGFIPCTYKLDKQAAQSANKQRWDTPTKRKWEVDKNGDCFQGMR
jgi:hypothetical protein